MQKKRRKSMPEKSPRHQERREVPSSDSEQLWVRPASNLRQGRETDGESNISPATAERLLKLADIALGVNKSVPDGKAKVLSVEAHHQKMSQRKKKVPPRSN